LLTWLNYYKYVLDNYAESCILFSYEQLCNSPDIVLNRLLKKIGVNDFIFKLPAFSSEKRIGVNFDSKILSDCMITYNRLTEMTS